MYEKPHYVNYLGIKDIATRNKEYTKDIIEYKKYKLMEQALDNNSKHTINNIKINTNYSNSFIADMIYFVTSCLLIILMGYIFTIIFNLSDELFNFFAKFMFSMIIIYFIFIIIGYSLGSIIRLFINKSSKK